MNVLIKDLIWNKCYVWPISSLSHYDTPKWRDEYSIPCTTMLERHTVFLCYLAVDSKTSQQKIGNPAEIWNHSPDEKVKYVRNKSYELSFLFFVFFFGFIPLWVRTLHRSSLYVLNPWLRWPSGYTFAMLVLIFLSTLYRPDAIPKIIWPVMPRPFYSHLHIVLQ